MNESGEFFVEQPKRLLSSPELPEISHHMVFDWGTLQVSRDAYEAYELVPLVATAEKGRYEGKPPKQADPAVNVLLLGPNEKLIEEGPEVPSFMTAVMSKAFLDRDGVGVVLTFDQAAKQAAAGRLRLIKEALQADRPFELEDTDLPLGPDGIPLPETLEHIFPQMYAHVLADAVKSTAEPVVAEVYRRAEVRIWSRRFATLGALGVIGAGCTLGFVSALQGDTNGLAIGAGGAYLTSVTITTHRQFNMHMENEPARRLLYELRASSLAESIAEDIHSTYCSKHFDRSIDTDADTAASESSE